MAVFHKWIHWILTVPLNKNNYEKELNTIKHIKKNNGYNMCILDKMLTTKIKKKKQFKIFFSANTPQGIKKN